MAVTILQNFKLEVGGVGYQGQFPRIKLPTIMRKMIEYDKPGGTGIQNITLPRVGKLETEMDLTGLTTLPFEMMENDDTLYVVRANYNDGANHDVKVEMSGPLMEMDLGELTNADEEQKTTHKLCNNFLSVEIDGVEKAYIDTVNDVLRINGVDLSPQFKTS